MARWMDSCMYRWIGIEKSIKRRADGHTDRYMVRPGNKQTERIDRKTCPKEKPMQKTDE